MRPLPTSPLPRLDRPMLLRLSYGHAYDAVVAWNVVRSRRSVGLWRGNATTFPSFLFELVTCREQRAVRAVDQTVGRSQTIRQRAREPTLLVRKEIYRRVDGDDRSPAGSMQTVPDPSLIRRPFQVYLMTLRRAGWKLDDVPSRLPGIVCCEHVAGAIDCNVHRDVESGLQIFRRFVGAFGKDGHESGIRVV